MKPKLYKNAIGAWVVVFPSGFMQPFLIYEDARKAIWEYVKDTIRLKKALHIIFYLDEATLSKNEHSLVDRIRTNMTCTKKQYGYLKGIQERQAGWKNVNIS